MSSAEAGARYSASLAAKVFSDKQMKIVANSDIVGAESLEEVRSELAKLPPDEIASLLKMMATDPPMLSEETLAGLASIPRRQRNSSSRELRHLRRKGES
ncbi:hypothetical protein [Nesterenkonia populi]|uniref:hypothetical protein n=1 Tax=Nesterenkonia populi TaxID=1591087 RepID=UPI0011BFB860|nr:hypothetical protein [Nesterenkonia populi]